MVRVVLRNPVASRCPSTSIELILGVFLVSVPKDRVEDANSLATTPFVLVCGVAVSNQGRRRCGNIKRCGRQRRRLPTTFLVAKRCKLSGSTSGPQQLTGGQKQQQNRYDGVVASAGVADNCEIAYGNTEANAAAFSRTVFD